MALIATDLDGTIVDARKRVSERTVRALRRCVADGDTVVFLTGRAPGDPMGELPADVLSEGRMFCANGAIEFDLLRSRLVSTRTIEEDALRHAIEVLMVRFPGGVFGIDALAGAVFQAGHPWTPDSLPRERQVHDVRDALDGRLGPYKATYLHPSVPPAEMVQAVGAQLRGVVGLTYGSTRTPMFVELTPPGVDKGTALAGFAAQRGFRREDIIAFGDMPNDIGMFRVAGTGYAMGGADPAVLAAATAITSDVEHNGVARVLEARARGLRGRHTS